MKSFVFDIDGVLIDSELANFTSLRRALNEFFGITISLEEDLFLGPIPTFLKLEYFAKKFSFSVDPLLKAEFLKKKFDYLLEELKLHDEKFNKESKEIFTFLKDKGIKTALVSNARSEYISFIKSELGIDELVDLSLGNDSSFKSKPSPDMYCFAIESLGSTPNQTVIFEDSEVGLTAAKASKANVVHVKSFGMLNSKLVKEIYERSDKFNFDFPADSQ